MGKNRPKTAFQGFFEAEPAPGRSFEVKNWLFAPSKVAESQSIRARAASVLIALAG
jgi:hypothetical protein